MSYCSSTEKKIVMMRGCLREERREGGKVHEENRALCTVFPYPMPISLAIQPGNRGSASSRGSTNSRLWILTLHSHTHSPVCWALVHL